MAAMIRLRLSILLFLQYFMMGMWFVPFGSYMSKGLHFDHVIGYAFGSQGIAAIVSAMIVGALADKVFSAERLLAILFFLSSLTLLLVGYQVHSVPLFLAATFLHFLVFIPTIPLANSLCFHWLAMPSVQFPRLRVLGTVGWIASGVLVGTIAHAAETRLPLFMAAGVGMLLSIYALTLPHTPPTGGAAQPTLASAFDFTIIRQQATRPFWILLVATLFIMLPMAFYYAYCNTFLVEAGAAARIFGLRFEPTALQSLGQVSELCFLLVLPLFLKHLGIKTVFLIGIASWILRYALFAFAYRGSDSIVWMLIVGILLHGAANDFIQVAGQVFVNDSFSAAARARAQALFTTVLMGIGAVVGSVIANVVYAAGSRSVNSHDWRFIWLVPAACSLATLLWFWISFDPRPDVRARVVS